MVHSQSSQTLAQVYENTFENPTSELLKPWTDESLEALRKRCKTLITEITSGPSFLTLLGQILGVLFIFIGAWLWGTSTPHPSLVLRVLLISGVVAMALKMLFSFPSNEEASALLILDGLTPLKHGDQCVTALRIVEHSTAARLYRDAVVCQGRELLHVDYAVMETLAREEFAKSEHFAQEQACKQLHGLDLAEPGR